MKNAIVAFALAATCGVALAGPVNINTADAETLAKELEGIGPMKAQAIVKYREENGPFKTPEDLKKLEVIHETVYEKNKTNIKIKD